MPGQEKAQAGSLCYTPSQTDLGGIALIAAVIVDLGLTAWFANWRDAAFAPGSLTQPPEALAALRNDLGTSGERLLSLSPVILSTRHRWPFCQPVHLDAAPLNLSAWWGVPNVMGSSPLGLKNHRELVLDAQPQFYQGCVAELFAVRYFMAPVRTFRMHDTDWDEVPLRTPSLGLGLGAERK